MKKTLLKLKDGVVFGIGFLLIIGIANAAWVNLSTVDSGQSLTKTLWDEMIGKINENGNKLDGITNVGGNIEISGNIKTNGYLNATNWPAFMVANDSGLQQSTTGIFPGNYPVYNNGGHYDVSTYKFTAPVSGIYNFAWTCLTLEESGRVQLVINESTYLTTESNGKSLFATVHLNKGDKVYLRGSEYYPMRWYGSYNHNGFSGNLIVAD